MVELLSESIFTYLHLLQQWWFTLTSHGSGLVEIRVGMHLLTFMVAVMIYFNLIWKLFSWNQIQYARTYIYCSSDDFTLTSYGSGLVEIRFNMHLLTFMAAVMIYTIQMFFNFTWKWFSWYQSQHASITLIHTLYVHTCTITGILAPK